MPPRGSAAIHQSCRACLKVGLSSFFLCCTYFTLLVQPKLQSGQLRAVVVPPPSREQLEARVGAVLRARKLDSLRRARLPSTELVAVGMEGLRYDQHGGSNHGQHHPAVLVQTSGNVAALRDLRQKHPAVSLSQDIGAGDFSEDLWLEGQSVDSGSVCIGDVFQGLRGGRPSGLELQVMSPRGVCQNLDAVLGDTPATREVSLTCARRSLGGWFLRVLSPGDVREGDVFRLLSRPWPQWTLDKVSGLLSGQQGAPGKADLQTLLESLADTSDLALFEWSEKGREASPARKIPATSQVAGLPAYAGPLAFLAFTALLASVATLIEMRLYGMTP
ncbi:unnamed protein product [Polarella glacialis]|uniref:MOSC domain-containing protein n=1 Tax=Polarella glacialis TaxID=89957 RepID=A0A813FKP4_POLGL|nr:unnamed protein product [Polarella glacialis]